LFGFRHMGKSKISLGLTGGEAHVVPHRRGIGRINDIFAPASPPSASAGGRARR
jgi:hypothetical protein